MSIKYKKGSEWGKWDLHVHTPSSINQHYGGNTDEAWEKFITDLEQLPEEFKVIGINDYIFLDGYKKVLKYKDSGRLRNINLILPVIELRIDKFGSVGDEAWKKVNFHIIFSNEIDVDTIQQQFLDAISHSHTLSPEYPSLDFSGIINKNSLEDFGRKIKESSSVTITDSDLKVGFNNITYSYDKVLETLNDSTYLKDKYLTAVGKTEWDALRWDSTIADKKTIINNADFVFISSETPEKFQTAKNKLIEQNVNSNLIDCSDAHSFSTSKDSNDKFIKDRIGKCFTWIKANPTFEGLKQINYEPEDRVKIQETNPAEEKQHWEILELEISNSNIDLLPNQKIEFNSNLVSVIGGRGAGKTVLLELISILSKCSSRTIDYFLKDEKDLDLNLTFLDRDNNKQEFKTKLSEYKENCEEFPIYYLTQDDIEKFSRSKNAVRDDFLKALDITESDIYYKDEIDFAENTISDIENLDSQELKIREELEEDKIINKKDSIGDIKFKIDNRVKVLKSEKDKVSTEKSKDIIDKLSEIKTKGINLAKIKDSQLITKIKTSIGSVNELFDSYNSELNDLEGKLELSNIEKIRIDVIEKVIESNNKTLDADIKILRKEYLKLKDELKDLGIKDVDSISKIVEKNDKEIIKLNSIKKELITLLSNRKDLFNKLLLTDNNQDQSSNSNDDHKSLPEKYKNTIETAKKDIDNKFAEFTIKSDSKLFKKVFSGIEISGEVYFDISQLKEDLKKLFYSGNNDFIDDLLKDVKSHEDYFDIFDNDFLEKLENNKNRIKSGDGEYYSLLKILFIGWKDYIKVQPKISLNEKELGGMSGGQEATLLLKLKLASDGILKDIILLDQPENHLDNKFINDELVKLIKYIKEEKQIIVASHNANVVVHSDSEEVIIANMDNDSEKQYFSGSLENKVILKGVVEILEGGKEALKNRIKKYNI